MKKKLISYLLCLTLGASLLAGCSSGSASASSSKETESAAESEDKEEPTENEEAEETESEDSVSEGEAVSAAFQETSGELLVGASKQMIVLPDDFFPYYGFRGRNFSEAIDDLYTRVLAFNNGGDTVLFAVIELGDVGGVELEGWLDEIEAETGVSRGNIFIHAEHVHSAPYAGSNYREEVEDVEKSDQFAEICGQAILEGCKEAIANMQPATMSYNTGECYINVNRDYKYTGDLDGNVQAAYLTWRNYDLDVDHTVAVVEFDDLNGDPIAFWSNYAVHSEVLFHAYNWGDGSYMAVSGDIAGRSVAYVEERYDGAVCLFTMGAAADAMPEYMAEGYVVDADGNVTLDYFDSADGAVEILQKQSDQLGEAIVNTIRSMEKSDKTDLTLSSLQTTVTVAGKVKWDEDPATCPSGIGTYEYDLDSPDVDLELGILKIGGFAVAMINAEIVGSIGADIQESLKEAGCEHVMVVSMTNGTVQYIADQWGFDNFTFEATQGWVAPGTGDIVVRETTNLLNTLK